MAEEDRTLIQRLRQWVFGSRKANRADQKERRDEFADFMEEHAADTKERAAAAREKRAQQ